MGLGARMLHSRLADPTLPPTERAFITRLAPAFTELAETAEDDALRRRRRAAARPSTASRTSPQLNALMEMLERRVSLLGVLSDALAERDVYVRIGARERDCPRCARCRSSPPTTACRSATSARSP